MPAWSPSSGSIWSGAISFGLVNVPVKLYSAVSKKTVRFNQLHDAPNVFVTDGACMTSTACQNPSLTYMALTARACHHAVDLLKHHEL